MEINKCTEGRSERTRYRFRGCTGEALYNNRCDSDNRIEIISLEEKNARSNSLIVACKKLGFVI